jgi:hypothetical protein
MIFNILIVAFLTWWVQDALTVDGLVLGATFTFFHEFKRYLATVINLESDQCIMYLSNDAPVVGTDTVVGDVAAITEENGYAAQALTESWTETGAGTGVWSFRHNADKTWTASGGNFGPFQYVVIYDDTPTSPADPLVGYWNVGAATTITDGNSFLVDLDADFAIFDLS